MDSRGFVPRLAGIEDMANFILESQGGRYVGKLWIHRFVQRQLDLKTCFNCVYDFQRALYKDPELIDTWFRLVENIRAKYRVLDYNFYNFDKTRFIIDIICTIMVIICVDQCSRGKAIQPENREQTTAIVCINSKGWNVPLFLVV